MHDLREAQLQYELDSDSAAQAERLRKLIEASQKGDVELPRAHALIGRMLASVIENIEMHANIKTRGVGGKFKNWLRALPSDVAAIIAIRECIRMCSSPKTHIHVQQLTFSVGKLWELEVRIRQAEAVNPVYMRKIHEQVQENCTRDYGHLRRLYSVAVERIMKGNLELDLNQTEMMNIGKFGVDACYEAGLLEIERGVNKNGTTVNYTLAPEVREFLTGYDSNDVRGLISKEETRMLCPPDEWTNLNDGGYLSMRRKAAAPLLNVRTLRKSARAHVVEAFTRENMPEVFDAGNYMQSIPYSLHQPTLQAIIRVWKTGGRVMGVPCTKGPQRPAFPFQDDWKKAEAPEQELMVFAKWKRTVAAYYGELREWRGKVREVGSFLRSTQEAQGPQWFPVFLDTRGRWYYRGLPNPQGSDLAKAVLHFHQKRKLGARGLYWLKVHIANSSGFDKERMDDRAHWTTQNWERICRALDAPEDDPEVWGTDAPWCVFSAAWELREALRCPRPEEYETGIPVHMDATCSGLQHYSALLRDHVGGKYVNLYDEELVGPKMDIYLHVAQCTLRMIEKDLNSDNPEIAALAAWCLDVGISRNLAKKPVMTYVYGATVSGTAEHVEWMLEREILPALGKSWMDPLRSFEYSMYIAKKLFAGIAAAVPAAAAAMQWLKTVARQQPYGKRMQWKTPTGFIVQHDYQDYTESRVRLNSCGVTVTRVREWNEGTQAHAMANAISPNFVHALDASHLTRVALRMNRKDMCMVAIHDSFGTHPSDVDDMHVFIREEFMRLYSGPNLLSEFLWDVQGVGEVPQRGSLDLSKVLESEFMFS